MLEISGDLALAAEQARAAVEADRRRAQANQGAEKSRSGRTKTQTCRRRRPSQGDRHHLPRPRRFPRPGRSPRERRKAASGWPAGTRVARRRRPRHGPHDSAAPLARVPFRRGRTRPLRPFHRAQKIGRHPRACRPAPRPGRGAALDLSKRSCSDCLTHPAAHGFVKGRSIRTNAAPARRQARARERRPERFLSHDHVPPRPRGTRTTGLFARRRHDLRPALHRIAAPQQSNTPAAPFTSPRARARFRKAPARARRSRISSPADSIRAWPASPPNSAGNTPATPTTCRFPPSREPPRAPKTPKPAICSPESATSPRTKASSSTKRKRASRTQRRDECHRNRRQRAPRRPPPRSPPPRAIVHNARKHGLASQNRANHPHFESQLRGRIAFVEMINPTKAAARGGLQQDQRGLRNHHVVRTNKLAIVSTVPSWEGRFVPSRSPIVRLLLICVLECEYNQHSRCKK